MDKIVGCRGGSGAILCGAFNKNLVQYPSRVKEKLAVDMF